ncbi:beta-N-acetylglucosaminidase domain-containing protein [Gracilimonas sp. BCB1]
MFCSKTDQHFEKIGVVEGFYGTPWTHEARLDMVRFMGEVGMDTYFYAPKDDPFHRAKWREPYVGEKLDEFSEFVSVSEESGVDLFFAISPGLDIVYSDSADFAALNNKIQAMVELGVEHFALFLDDVPQHLRHTADKEQYENLAAAHADLINRIWNKLKEQNIEFVVCSREAAHEKRESVSR